MNSGGPNQLGLLKPEFEDQLNVGNVWKLRNQNIQPDGTNSFGPTPLGERFIEAFTEDAPPGVSGFQERTPLPTDAPGALMRSGFCGYPSSIYPSPMGRHFLAEKLRARFSAGPARLSLHLGTKIVRLLFEETPTGRQVIGVVAQPQYGGEVVYRAGKKIILAAGIFGTFSLLVDSGIGPPDALNTREVATADRVIENCHIGKEVGDEVQVTCLFVAAEDQGGPPPHGRVAPLVGARAGDDSCRRTQLVVWARGLPSILMLITQLQPWLQNLLRPFARHWSYISVSLDSVHPVTGKPTMALKATKDSVVMDDSHLNLTSEMMKGYKSQMPALQKFLSLNRKAPQSYSRWWHRFWLRVLTPLIHSPGGIGRFFGMPPGVDEYNLNVTSYKQLQTYNHFYGGAQQGTVLNGNFELYLTPPSPNKTEEENRNRNTMKGLHIADASVIPALTPGGPTATVMEVGMLVAKRVCGEKLAPEKLAPEKLAPDTDARGKNVSSDQRSPQLQRAIAASLAAIAAPTSGSDIAAATEAPASGSSPAGRKLHWWKLHRKLHRKPAPVAKT